jgi:type II secretory pathway pseudopilin PulG
MGAWVRYRWVRQDGRSRRWVVAGIALLSLMLGLFILEVLTGLALPSWQMWAQRERELELLWRGCQYREAIREFHRWCGRYPNSVDELLDKTKIAGDCDTSRPGFPLRFLRRAYPGTFSGRVEVRLYDPGAGAVSGPGQGELDQGRPELGPRRGRHCLRRHATA